MTNSLTLFTHPSVNIKQHLANKFVFLRSENAKTRFQVRVYIE